MRLRTDVSDHAAFWIMPCFAVVDVQVDGTAGGTVQNRLGHTAAESGHIPKGALVHWECSCCGRRCRGGMLTCTSGAPRVGWSSRAGKVCVMMLVLQCQC